MLDVLFCYMQELRMFQGQKKPDFSSLRQLADIETSIDHATFLY
jgi:hypothetical protein